MTANGELLHDIKPTSKPINDHCNAGTVSVQQDGLMGDYPERVWFNPHGIANILSLWNVSQYYRVTMDTRNQMLSFSIARTVQPSLLHLAAKDFIILLYKIMSLSILFGP